MKLPGVLGVFAAMAWPGEVERTRWDPEPPARENRRTKAKRRQAKRSRKRNRR